MRLVFHKRFFTSFASLNVEATQTQVAKEYRIVHCCRVGALPDAIHLLNSIDWTKLYNKPFFYGSLLQTCTKVGSFRHGLQMHAHVVKSGIETDRFVGNCLLALYFKLGPNISDARVVFEGLLVKDVISWTSMITGYVKSGKPINALELFREMLEFGVEPNAFTLSSVIKACSELGNLHSGKCFHGVVMNCGFHTNDVIASALIDMYGKNSQVEDACKLFDELQAPDAICWTSVLSAFTRNEMYNEALGFFCTMRRRDQFLLDGFIFGTMLTACGNLGRLKQGKEMHAQVVTTGFCGNVVVESSLLDMYGKCGMVNESQHVFDRMEVKNSVSWSALLGAYCHNGDFESAIRIFREVKHEDLYSFGTVLRACAGLAAIRQGKEVHCQYVRRGGWRDVIIESALVDLYAKCGCIDFAYRVFIQMPMRNLITWNSMICGFAQNGRVEEVFEIFDNMIEKGTKPDYISFVGVLFACSHTGLVDQGRKYFTSMTEEYGIKPGIEHYNCMVDLLGRSGLLEEAKSLIENAGRRDDSSLWEILLGACAECTLTHSSTAESIAMKIMELKPDSHLSYVYLTNVYRSVGRWEDALKVWTLMKDRGVAKTPGKSWVDSHSMMMRSYLDMGGFNKSAEDKF